MTEISNILIVGNMGYVGPVVAAHLRSSRPDCRLYGFDSGFFRDCTIVPGARPEAALRKQIIGDVRELDCAVLEGIDAIVQLAAVSNDPMGKQFEDATREINFESTCFLARTAAAAGVKAFVFASSCSVYGVAEGGPRREGDPIAPLTAYARSKIAAEDELRRLDSGMTITALRFATACGMSPRLRLDLVLNDFVAAALAKGRVSVLSDGSPWRPLIDVADMARAIEWAIFRDAASSDPFLVVNAGATDHNFQVRDLAYAVADALPGTEVSINTQAPVDSRSYQVDFGLYERLAPDHRPKMSLQDSISQLIDGLRGIDFTDRDPRSAHMIRLEVLQQHINAGRLGRDLRWRAAR
jgi:nucleoside-diphosphate-sugar epimerase